MPVPDNKGGKMVGTVSLFLLECDILTLVLPYEHRMERIGSKVGGAPLGGAVPPPLSDTQLPENAGRSDLWRYLHNNLDGLHICIPAVIIEKGWRKAAKCERRQHGKRKGKQSIAPRQKSIHYWGSIMLINTRKNLNISEEDLKNNDYLYHSIRPPTPKAANRINKTWKTAGTVNNDCAVFVGLASDLLVSFYSCATLAHLQDKFIRTYFIIYCYSLK